MTLNLRWPELIWGPYKPKVSLLPSHEVVSEGGLDVSGTPRPSVLQATPRTSELPDSQGDSAPYSVLHTHDGDNRPLSRPMTTKECSERGIDLYNEAPDFYAEQEIGGDE